jgi:hypothetical protein
MLQAAHTDVKIVPCGEPEKGSNDAGFEGTRGWVTSPGRRENMADFDFRSASVEDMLGAFFADGCVLLRNFVDSDDLASLGKVVDDLYDELGCFHIETGHLQGRGLQPFHAYLFGAKHDALLSHMFREHAYIIDRNTASRRVDGIAAQGSWMRPLAPHIDAFFHDFKFTVNFWIPFQPCGVERPSLGVVRARFSEVLNFVGYDGGPVVHGPNNEWNKARFNKMTRDMTYSEPHAIEYFRETFADRIWTPTYGIGDALLLSNWTLHFTHATPEMTGRRGNLELRFSCDASLEEMLEKYGVAVP